MLFSELSVHFALNYFFNNKFKYVYAMYAIVEIAGQQFKVAKDQKVFVHRLASEEGNNVSFDKVLLLDNDGEVTIGAPANKRSFC